MVGVFGVWRGLCEPGWDSLKVSVLVSAGRGATIGGSDRLRGLMLWGKMAGARTTLENESFNARTSCALWRLVGEGIPVRRWSPTQSIALMPTAMSTERLGKTGVIPGKTTK